jgi:carboxyl-terminal processing protease
MKTQITRKQVVNLAALLLICGTWFAIGWIARSAQSATPFWTLTQRGPETELVEQARQLLMSEHAGEVPPTRELTYAAIRGMLRNVEDAHAALLTPPVSQRFQDDFGGKSGVIGLFPERQDGQVVVSVVFPDEPADQAGLRAGDVILSVDGVEFGPDTSDAEAILLIRGPVGTPAHFVVKRGAEILQFDPIRQERRIVSARMLPEGIAYLAQYTFTTNAGPKMQQALQGLLAHNPKGLIWDLSSNGGGSMEAAQEILSYFIQDGLLFTAELKGEQQTKFTAEGQAIAADIPLVVLVGERTYSAAETAAAAIAETGRGTLIGSTTYGKGTIHAIYPLGEDALLQMTIAKWLSPTGQWYDGRGVTPEIVVNDAESDEKVLQFAVEYLLQNLTP